MKIIYKYYLPEGNVDFSLMIPKNAEILSVQLQGMKPCLWASFEEGEEPVKRNFLQVGTGIKFEGNLKYLGTYQTEIKEFSLRNYAWHLYEKI